MALADLTILTLLFEFLPPLIVSFVYLLFFRKRKSKLIEVFIGVMYLKTITWFLFTIALDANVVTMANPSLDTTGLAWTLLTDMLFQFAFSLQDFLTWILIAFYAVLFGMVVLAVKLLLQDPLKMRFKNVIRKITRKEPESDGFSGFRDRVNNIRFEGVEPQPLNPEVQSKAWQDAWRDYLIIGLATLIPSLSAYMGSLPAYIHALDSGTPQIVNNYLLAITILLTWIYRFGYPASNRIAKGAGLHLGDRDMGSEMMRGVLGWFFRLNILLSAYTIIEQVWTVLNSDIAGAAGYVVSYYITGLLYAAPPIIFAILILPIAEDFAVVFYKKLFEAIVHARSKLGSINIRLTIENLVAGVGTGFLISLAFIGAVVAATLNYTMGAFLFPRQLGNSVEYAIGGASSNYELFAPVVWTLLMLAIPFTFMLITGIIGHMARKRIGGGIETFALLSGATVSLLTYFYLTGMDYILAAFTTSSDYAGYIFNRIIPVPIVPGDELFIWRLASQFVINLPMFIFTALFILYFFDFRAKWKETIGDIEGPLLNTHKRDIIDSVLMFFGGLAVSLVGVWIVTLAIANPGFVLSTLDALLRKIGDPDGLEAILIPTTYNPGGWFVIFAEHNIIRTLLMLIIGPVFWSAVLWFVGVKKSGKEKIVGTWSVVLLVICAAATYVWTQFDAAQGVFNSYDPILGFAAQLGYRAVIIFGIPVLLIGLVSIANVARGKGIGSTWFPLFIMIFAIEYFVYDDQFTLIALIVIPFFLAAGYRLFFSKQSTSERVVSGDDEEVEIHYESKSEDFLITFIKFSLMSLAISEVLSTALTVGGIAIIQLTAPPPFGGNVARFLASILPHAILEIPVFLVAAAAAIRIGKNLWPTVEAEDWESIPSRTRSLLGDERTWRTFALIAFMLIIAALIEAFVTPHIMAMF
ncbi:stage II sporulation protein M [Candidatus Thorarchaeota archaeon]|nr:MAG: stage II sporulation protein M [Candidatus Thorarchaeota archaeon]